MSNVEERRIDWRQVRALVRAFVLMSVRTMPIRTMRGEKRGSGVGSILVMIGIFTLFGTFMSAMAAVLKDVFVFSFTLHTMTLVLIGTSAMSEASEVLFSTSENDILLHRPIQPSTLVLSKAITIIAFTLLLSGALNLAPTIAIGLMSDARGWAPLAHIVSVILATVFASASVVCLYGLIARLLGRARLQKVVTAAQIASTLVLVLGFQLVPRLFDPRNGFDAVSFLHGSVSTWFLPPAWFAAIDAWIGSKTFDPHFAGLALIGIGVTAVCAWLGIVRLPTTGSNAASIQEETRDDIVVKVDATGSIAGSKSWVDKLTAPFVRDPVERASFNLAKAYLTRDRNVKVRLASAFGVFLVFPLLSLIDAHGPKVMPVMFFWMTALVPLTFVESLRISSNPAAADLFLYSPIEKGASVFHGVRKAGILLVQVPMALYIATVAAWAARSNPQMLLLMIPALFVFPTVSLIPGMMDSYLPLSIGARTGQRAMQSLLFLVVMVPAGLVALLAFWAQKQGLLWLMVAVEAVTMLALHALLLRVVAKRAVTGRRRKEKSSGSEGWSASS